MQLLLHPAHALPSKGWTLYLLLRQQVPHTTWYVVLLSAWKGQDWEEGVSWGRFSSTPPWRPCAGLGSASVLWTSALHLKATWERDSQSFPCRRQFQTMYPKRTRLQEKLRKARNQTCFIRFSFLQGHSVHLYHKPQPALCLPLGPCNPEAAREALSSWAPGG